MADGNDLYFFGDDFDVVLSILEEEDDLDNQFTTAANEVEPENIVCKLCQKRCKSKGGLKRHTTVMHPDHSSKKEVHEQEQLTTEIFLSIIEKAKARIVNNKIYTSFVDEVSAYSHQCHTDSDEFSHLQEIYSKLARTGNAESFYSTFYCSVANNADKYFPNLSSTIATLLSAKVADCLLVHYQESKDRVVKETVKCDKLSTIELSGLQYLGGYVLHKLHKKFASSKTKVTENEQAMAVLKAGKADGNLMSEHNKLTSSLNRGGLWAITKSAQLIFERTEHYFKHATSNATPHKIDCSNVIAKTMVDVDVLNAYNSLLSQSELAIQNSVAKDVLHSIIQLYTRVRSFSFAKDIIQKHKVNSKQLKSKALRKDISRVSKESDQERLS